MKRSHAYSLAAIILLSAFAQAHASTTANPTRGEVRSACGRTKGCKMNVHGNGDIVVSVGDKNVGFCPREVNTCYPTRVLPHSPFRGDHGEAHEAERSDSGAGQGSVGGAP